MRRSSKNVHLCVQRNGFCGEIQFKPLEIQWVEKRTWYKQSIHLCRVVKMCSICLFFFFCSVIPLEFPCRHIRLVFIPTLKMWLKCPRLTQWNNNNFMCWGKICGLEYLSSICLYIIFSISMNVARGGSSKRKHTQPSTHFMCVSVIRNWMWWWWWWCAGVL